jgi:2-desacetyl-2-hydroxyethyl bacteriochlorophyllide A dehydrogenase
VRAAVFKAVGRPLVIENRPDPVPGAGELVIKVGRCGVCGTDLAMSDGRGQVFEANTIIGHEFAGEVVAVGEGVDRFRVGDRVTAMPYTGCGKCPTCIAGRPNFCGAFRGIAAGFAEYAPTAALTTVKLPSSLSLADGALVEPLAVGLHGAALARIEPGQRVLVIGAGPIGLAAMYWARKLGAGTIAVTASSRQREPIALALGASAFIVAEPPEELAQLAAGALGGAPDLVIEAVGKPDLIAQSINCVRPGGTVVVLGFCSRPDTFVPALAVWKEVRLQFSMTYSLGEFEHVARSLDRGEVEPRAMITDTVCLEAFPEAFEAMRHRTHQCKVMVDPWATRP